MRGLMQGQPLLLSFLMDVAEHHHADAQCVSRWIEGDFIGTHQKDVATCAPRLAYALERRMAGAHSSELEE